LKLLISHRERECEARRDKSPLWRNGTEQGCIINAIPASDCQPATSRQNIAKSEKLMTKSEMD